MSRLIRTLTLREIETLLQWAAAEGWNPGLDDAPAFQAADPDGFFGAFVDEQMVAGISAVAYDDRFGFIGLYISHPDWRGQGHGKAVWDHAMAYLGSRTVGLDGVVEQQANYRSMGFVPAYETVRMSGTLADRGISGLGHAVVQPADVTVLDRTCFPAARGAFLSHWLSAPRSPMLHRRDGVVDGYAVTRPCRDGHKIGPLFASGMDTALELLATQSGVLHVDVPTGQSAWLAELGQRGFIEGFKTMRMYKGEPPALDLSRVFAISTLELG